VRVVQRLEKSQRARFQPAGESKPHNVAEAQKEDNQYYGGGNEPWRERLVNVLFRRKKPGIRDINRYLSLHSRETKEGEEEEPNTVELLLGVGLKEFEKACA
jgi:hypothetical protein